MVLGVGDHEVIHLALGIGDDLADNMGEAHENTSSRLMARGNWPASSLQLARRS